MRNTVEVQIPENFFMVTQLPPVNPSVIYQEVEHMALKPQVPKEVSSVVTEHFLWGETHIFSFILLLIGGIITGRWVIRRLLVLHSDTNDQQLADNSSAPENKGNSSTDSDHDVILVTMRRKHFQQCQSVQTYAENYRFYPLTEALLIGSVIFIAIFLTSYFIFYHALEAQKDEIREGLVRTAQAMTTTIDPQLHRTFIHKEQEETEAYQTFCSNFSAQ